MNWQDKILQELKSRSNELSTRLDFIYDEIRFMRVTIEKLVTKEQIGDLETAVISMSDALVELLKKKD